MVFPLLPASDISLTHKTIRRRKRQMLRTALIAAALACASQAVSAQELTAEQRNACMGDYEKYC
jgi:hypothetical protein